MSKYWKKNQDNSFTFFVDDQETGSIEFTFDRTTKSAAFNIGPKHFSIIRKGFWNSTLFITDNSEQEVAKLYAEKWFVNNWALEYADKIYKLSVRNNPLAEYVISDEKNEILVYGLKAGGGKAAIKITGINTQGSFIFDFLLWYLFAPVAVENMGDNLMFSLLLTQ